MDSLSNDNILEIALEIPIYSISQFCQTSKRFNRIICNNEWFWKQKFIRDHGEISWTGSWLWLYQNYMNAWSFGFNTFGQLGHSDRISRNIPEQILDLEPKYVSAGFYHTVVIDLYDNVWMFGNESYYDSIPTQIPNFKAKQVSAGNHTLMIDFDDNVWTIKTSHMIDNNTVPNQIPDLKAKQVSTGNGCTHSIIIDLNNDIWTFGYNMNGELGLGDYKNRDVPTKIQRLKAKQVSAGGKHTMFIDLANYVWAFGSNRYGQLGINDELNRRRDIPRQIMFLKAKQVSAGGYHTLLIDLDDNVWAFGNNDEGQLGLGDNERRYSPVQIPNLKAKQVSAGTKHSIVIDLHDNIWVFGGNLHWQLGISDNDEYRKYRIIPTLIPNLKAKQASAGFGHSIVIAKQLKIDCDNEQLHNETKCNQYHRISGFRRSKSKFPLIGKISTCSMKLRR